LCTTTAVLTPRRDDVERDARLASPHGSKTVPLPWLPGYASTARGLLGSQFAREPRAGRRSAVVIVDVGRAEPLSGEGARTKSCLARGNVGNDGRNPGHLRSDGEFGHEGPRVGVAKVGF
jgi:hypothetical protein